MSCGNKQFSVIQLRRGLEADFINSNIVLASGEPAYTLDTNLFKIGDGVTPWNDLHDLQSSGNYNFYNSVSGIVTQILNQLNILGY